MSSVGNSWRGELVLEFDFKKAEGSANGLSQELMLENPNLSTPGVGWEGAEGE